MNYKQGKLICQPSPQSDPNPIRTAIVQALTSNNRGQHKSHIHPQLTKISTQ